jgi:large subunit ribosomal protein L21
MADYAIVQTGGKQYRVRKDDVIRVESLRGDEGDSIDLGEVLMVSREGDVTVGTPTVAGASVSTEIVSQGKGKKIVVFKYKSKSRYRRKNGHRQPFTELRVTGITLRKRRRTARSKTDGA